MFVVCIFLVVVVEYCDKCKCDGYKFWVLVIVVCSEYLLSLLEGLIGWLVIIDIELVDVFVVIWWIECKGNLESVRCIL